MAEEITMAIIGNTNAICSERWSATQPIMVGEGTSPRMWIIKMFTASAVARIWAPTELMTAALSGEVFSNKKNAAQAIAGIMSGPFTNKATVITGTPSNMLAAETM